MEKLKTRKLLNVWPPTRFHPKTGKRQIWRADPKRPSGGVWDSRVGKAMDIEEDIIKNPDNWKQHPQFPQYWFEENTSRYYNQNTRKSRFGKNNNGTTDICLSESGRGSKLSEIRSTTFNYRKEKWRLFNGPIPAHHIVRLKNKEITAEKQFALDNLECVTLYCATCDKMIENPDPRGAGRTSNLNVFCSTKCSGTARRIKHNARHKTDTRVYIAAKCKSWAASTDYCMSIITDNCQYCGIKLYPYGTEAGIYRSDKLSFDAIIPGMFMDPSCSREEAHREGNLVCCCLFCNHMKHTMEASAFKKIIAFLETHEQKILDYSSQKFLDIDGRINKNDKPRPWKCLSRPRGSPKYYTEKGSNIQTYINIHKKQNGLDAIFNFFPLVYFTRRGGMNASCDAIDCNLSLEEKHRPDNIQLIPEFLNEAKNIGTNEELIQEFKKRNWKTDFTDCKIILPPNYKEKSYLETRIKIGGGKVVLTRQGYHHSDETKEKIRQKRLSGNYSGKKNARSKPVHMLSLNDEILQTFESCCLAAKSLNGNAGNISTCANGKYITNFVYGHKWKWASKN